jgi:hypothetical protein
MTQPAEHMDDHLIPGRAAPQRGLSRRQDNVACVLTIHPPHGDLIVAAGVQQSYFGDDEFAPHVPGVTAPGDALVIRRRWVTLVDLLDSSIRVGRASTQRPDRLGLG